ncbi:MAG: adenylyl-sulfate kinase [Candidatus Lokiarchaeota archaeon]|nr:adenylyl-sulfate kinase [Candidatus Lokiarchaeota archaeon]
MNPKSFAVWLTGLPGAGKSVISDKLQQILKKEEIHADIIRMDEMRKYVTPDPKYTDEERKLVYNSFSYCAKKLVENNINVIMDATGNLRKYRALAKKIIPNYLEIFIKCPLEIAIKRESGRKETKGAPTDIYEKAREGQAETVPGIQNEYEEPRNPDLVVESDKLSIKESANLIYEKIISEFP